MILFSLERGGEGVGALMRVEAPIRMSMVYAYNMVVVESDRDWGWPVLLLTVHSFIKGPIKLASAVLCLRNSSFTYRSPNALSSGGNPLCNLKMDLYRKRTRAKCCGPMCEAMFFFSQDKVSQ